MSIFGSIRNLFGRGRNCDIPQLDLDQISRKLSSQYVINDENCNIQNSEQSNLFFVLGPKNSDKHSMAIFYQYPSQKISNENSMHLLLQLCFPKGIYASTATDTIITEQFVFTTNEGGNRRYGVCTHFVCPRYPIFSLKEPTNFVYCICNLTTKPAIADIFRFQREVLEKIQSKSIHQMVRRISKSLIAPKDFLHEIAYASYGVLLSSLGVKNTVRYLRALMLEQRILVVSKDISKASMLVLSSLALVTPMRNKSVVMTLLPNTRKFIEYIGSPLPFVFGAYNSDILYPLKSDPDINIIDADDGSYRYPKSTPKLPGSRDLCADLRRVIQNYTLAEGGSREKRALLFLTKEEIDSIFSIFESFVQKFVLKEKLETCRIRNLTDHTQPKVGFVKEVYLVGEKPESIPFLDQFTQTQLFISYFENTV